MHCSTPGSGPDRLYHQQNAHDNEFKAQIYHPDIYRMHISFLVHHFRKDIEDAE